MARSKFRSQATANSNAIELFGRKKEPEQNLWIAVIAKALDDALYQNDLREAQIAIDAKKRRKGIILEQPRNINKIPLGNCQISLDSFNVYFDQPGPPGLTFFTKLSKVFSSSGGVIKVAIIQTIVVSKEPITIFSHS